VPCDACGHDFWITCDTLNTAYQFLIDDAKEHFHLKRYMPAIASLAQAWEVFFAEYAWGRYVYAPFFAGDPYSQDIDELHSLSRQLASATRRFAFVAMRNLLINTVARSIQPTSVEQATSAISRIALEKLDSDAPQSLYAEVQELQIREALEQLRDVTVNELRNHVIQKHAYRPRRAEVEPCLREEVRVLYRLKHRLNVMDFTEYQMSAA